MKTRWNFGQAHGLARAQIAVIIGISLLFVALSSSLGDGGVRPVFAASVTDFTQCQNDNNNDGVLENCDWTTGALNQNNSVLSEGDIVAHRLIHSGISGIGIHTFVFEFDFTKGGIHSYDFASNYNGPPIGGLLNQCADLSAADTTLCNNLYNGTGAADSLLVPIPSDGTNGVSAREYPGTRQWRVGCSSSCSAIITAISAASGSVAADSSKTITLQITTTTATTDIAVWMGMHIAAGPDPDGGGPATGWGTNCNGGTGSCGAAGISGAPFHYKYNTLDGDSVGNRDNQIQPGAIVAPGTIVIVKDAVPNNAQDFAFTTTGTGLSAFSLDDDGETTILSNTKTFTGLTAGSYTVSEGANPTGWSLTNIVCTDPTTNSTVNLGTRTASIALAAGETVTCTFTNTALPPDTTSIVTTLHDAAHGTVANGASVPLGTVMHDSAAVTNTGTPNYGTPQGTVNFFFFGNGVTCPPQGQGTAGGTASGSIALSGGVAHPSSNQGPLAAGSYNFKAVFASSDTSKWLNSESACEPFTVDKAATTTATELHNHDTEAVIAENSTQPLATSVHDKATVSTTSTFATAPTGSVTFYFFGAGVPCPAGTSTTGGTQLNSVTLVAGVAHPSTPTQSNLPQGSYAFKAVYSGDNNYLGSTSACEPFSIGKANPTVATTLHKAPHDVVAINTAVDLGTVMHDSATVSPKVDGLNITGNVTFSFYNNGTCTPGTNNANVVFTSTVGLVPDTNDSTAHPSTSTSALAAGSYAFRAVYNGDDNYNTATSACEPFTVSKASTSTATQIHLGSNHTTDVQSTTITLGSTIHDSATVTSTNPSFTIGGTVAFTFYNNGDCTGQGTDAGSAIAVSGGVAHPSTSQGPLQAGSYSFKAVYSGDTNYLGSTGSCETVTVGQASTTTTTAIHLGTDHTTDVQNTTIALGSTIHDSASVTSTNTSFAIGGTVAFTFYNTGDCTGQGTDAGSAIAVSGGVAHPSTSQGPLQAGSYSFKAVYGGDTNYTGSTGPCEVVTVGQANPKVSKVPSATSVVQGTSFTYTVRVQNDGTQPALNVILTDSGFSGGTITAISSADGVFACEGSGLNLVNGFTCNIASIAVNQTIDFIVTVRANTVCTPINNTASVAYDVQLGSGGNGKTTDDSAQAVQITVTGCTVDILGTKTQRIGAAGTFVTTNLTANVNNVIQYQLTVTNAGNQPLTGVTISDTFPAGTGSLAEVSDPSNLCSVAGNVLSCSGISLAAGQSYTVTVSVVLQVCTTVINQGTVDSNETAGESTNAVQVTCTILPPPPPPPPLIIQVLPQPPLISEVLPARLPVTGNAGDSEAEGGIGSSWLLVLGLPLAGLALVATALIARRRKA